MNIRTVYNRLGSGYNTLTQAVNTAGVLGLRDRLVSRAEGDVLEVGVGAGGNFRHYPLNISSLVGVDISSAMLDSASKAARRYYFAFSPVEADAMKLPFADASFDTVVSTLTGCMFENPVLAYREMIRVCRPDGKILLMEHTYPKTTARRALFTAMRPIARYCVGCDPLRDTESAIRESRLDIVERESAVSEIFLSLVAKASSH